ncbi:MAG: 50S ribosomal protein L29 [Synergistaceae bacterium]|jgi:large subunit ribosomal protein L29|nr:50S ribosomal protein L29 [Synergistaceae bacterium]NLI95257.1 50S ribosomal protein L29 [Synergistaceae bacterium]
MKAKDFRDLTLEELQDKHRQYKEELFNLRFQSAIGQQGNHSRISEVKRTIARILTVKREKEIAMERATARR